MMILSIIALIKKKPYKAIFLPFHLLRGKAYFKQVLYQYMQLDISALAYNQSVIDYIKERKAQNDYVVLATASHQAYASAIAKHLKLFDAAYGTPQDNKNLSAHYKAKFLVKKYGYRQFDYIGDHKRDIAVWNACHLAIIVNPSQRLKKQTEHLNRYIL